MLSGLLLALVASAMFNAAVAVQALDARTLPAELALTPSLLMRLARRRRWRIAMGLAALGWPLHAAALGLAPLTAVQPALAAGLLVLLAVAARRLGEPVGVREVTGVLLIVGGEAVMAWAAPNRSSSHAHGLGLATALVALAIIALLPYVLRRRSATGWPAVMSAGVAFALTGFVTKLVSDELSSGTIVAAWLWATLVGAAAVVGVLSENSALQTRPASQVAPLVFSAQTVLPVLLAPLVGGEDWTHTPLGGGAVLLALLAVVAGVVTIARSRALGALIEGHAVVQPQEQRRGSEADRQRGTSHHEVQVAEAEHAGEAARRS